MFDLNMADGFVRKKVESLTLGEKLVKLRSQYRMSLAEISKATRIQAKYLEALESGDYSALPAEVYIRGFLRSYARYLGLEETAFVKLYDKEKHIRTHLGQEPPKKERTVISIQKAWVITPKTIAYGAIALVLVGTFAYLFRELHSFVAEPRLVITSPAPGFATEEAALLVTGETDAGAQVQLNGEAVFVAVDGTFRELLTLQPGSNTLHLLATNRFDKTKEVVLVVEHTTHPKEENEAWPAAAVSVSRSIERITLEVDGVVVWNGPWGPDKRETVMVKDFLRLTTSDPAGTLLSFGERVAEPLGPATTPELTKAYTRSEIEASIQAPKDKLSPVVP